jgi:hypothetical protein
MPYVSSGGMVKIVGDVTTPVNCPLNCTGIAFANQYAGCTYYVAGFSITATSGWCFLANQNSVIQLGKNQYNALSAGYAHMYALNGAVISMDLVAYTIAGGGGYHVQANSNGMVYVGFNSQLVTITGTPAFTQFAIADRGGIVSYFGMTFTGTATGSRYSASLNSIIFVNGGGATFLPGNTAGTTATGGQYG